MIVMMMMVMALGRTKDDRRRFYLSIAIISHTFYLTVKVTMVLYDDHAAQLVQVGLDAFERLECTDLQLVRGMIAEMRNYASLRNGYS